MQHASIICSPSFPIPYNTGESPFDPKKKEKNPPPPRVLDAMRIIKSYTYTPRAYAVFPTMRCSFHVC